MTNLTRAAVVATLATLLIASPRLAAAQAPESKANCGTLATFELQNARSVSARSGGYYPATEMGFSVSPKVWSRSGLGVTGLVLDTSGAMAWGIGPRWRHVWVASDQVATMVFAQVVAGAMDTAVTVSPATSGRFVQATAGASISYRQYSIGLQVAHADAPTLAPSTERRVGRMQGTRVSVITGFRFKRYPAPAGPCGGEEVALAIAKEHEATQQQQAASTPRVALFWGFNGPQQQYAEFPGFSLGVHGFMGKRSRGIAPMAMIDASYLRQTTVVGARAYSRSEGLQRGRSGSTAYVQLAAGTSKGAVEGIMHSTGGVTMMPGAGIEFGGNRKAMFIQADYLAVRDSDVRNDREPSYRGTMSGGRFTIGFIRRFSR